MATLKRLPELTRKALAIQIGALRNPVPTLLDYSPVVELGEDLETWTLDVSLLNEVSSIQAIAYKIDYWTHLLRRNGKGHQIASSAYDDKTGNIRLHAIADSPIAPQIDQAMDWLDENDKSDSIVRLLSIPVFGIYVFWLSESRKDRILLIDMAWLIHGLEYEHLYTDEDFLVSLSRLAIPKMPTH